MQETFILTVLGIFCLWRALTSRKAFVLTVEKKKERDIVRIRQNADGNYTADTYDEEALTAFLVSTKEGAKATVTALPFILSRMERETAQKYVDILIETEKQIREEKEKKQND